MFKQSREPAHDEIVRTHVISYFLDPPAKRLPVVIAPDNAASKDHAIDAQAGIFPESTGQDICSIAVADEMHLAKIGEFSLHLGELVHEPTYIPLTVRPQKQWSHAEIAIACPMHVQLRSRTRIS